MKKGIMFTFIATILSAIVITMFFSLTEVPADKDIPVTKIKITQSSRFLEQTEEYTKMQLQASTKSTIEMMVQEMIKHDTFYADFDQEFNKCMVDGIITNLSTGLNIECKTGLKKKLDKLTEFANETLNVGEINISVDGLYYEQNSPWELDVEINISINLTNSYAKWNTSGKQINTEIEIMNITDPTYHVGIDPQVTTLEYSPYKKFETKNNRDEWNETPSTLNEYFEEEYYFHTTQGPSFLQRLRGDSDQVSACCGIASLVNHSTVYSTALPYYRERGHAGFMFWPAGRDCMATGINLNIFDFWKPGLFHADRAVLGITNNPEGHRLNSTIIPLGLTDNIGMDGLTYDYFVPSTTC